eukprot:CAMPEP_0116867324 /NCGR_PEP_ID=MMETSP0418-20121206/26551_1 /TAXON_ID=1158023 /ORGANISM="Astrosyne radiata, Strain 13vi08-1A" /LENGTH=105 /DNA_ID=CAMNT_0004503117 /DNA_START=44 /DNA_END=358 /DNA_ORIENTATION=-
MQALAMENHERLQMELARQCEMEEKRKECAALFWRFAINKAFMEAKIQDKEKRTAGRIRNQSVHTRYKSRNTFVNTRDKTFRKTICTGYTIRMETGEIARGDGIL